MEQSNKINLKKAEWRDKISPFDISGRKNRLPICQTGFRKKYSTIGNLMYLQQKIHNTFANKK